MIDIARRANVSRTAVTHVLTGAGAGHIGGVSAGKAREIRRIAAELGYVPNFAAQQLAGKRSGILAALASRWNMATERRLLGWFEQVATGRGFDLLGGQSSDDLKLVERFLQNCRSRCVDGLIVMAFASDELWSDAGPLFAEFPRVVTVVGNPGFKGVPCIESDIAGGARQSVLHLHKQGRKKIVHILESLDTAMNRCRYDAFLATHHELGRPATEDQLCLATRGWTHNDNEKMAALCEELLDRGMDAVLADTDFTACMLIRALADRGLRVPQDVAVVGWGDEEIASWHNPKLTTVSYEFRQVAESAIELLANWIENTATNELPTGAVPMKLIVRESA